MKEKPDASLAEHGEMLEKGTGLKISEATIHRIFARRRITVKKTVYATERDEAERAAYLNDISSILTDLERFVCVDESSFNLAMARRHARSPIGERAIDFITRNQGINQSLICAMKASGPFASFIFEGPINKDAFVWYVEHILCPELVAGQVVFLDNLSAHHVDEVIDLIEDFGCTVQYLPRYSPDLNPIEMLFSKVKALVRAGRWRDLKLLWKSIWDARSSVTPENCGKFKLLALISDDGSVIQGACDTPTLFGVCYSVNAVL